MSKDVRTAWVDAPVETAGDAVVEAMSAGGIDHLFFTSGSDIGFYQEAIAKAHAKGHNNPIRLVTVPLEHASLNAALGYAAVSGKPVATAAHVDVGTLHYGGAIHTAWRSALPVVLTAGFPPTAYSGTMKGSRNEGGHIWLQETFDQNGILRNYTKWDHRFTAQDNAGLITSRAIQVARAEPSGPVYMSIPKEITLMEPDETRFPSADQLGIPGPTGLAADAALEIAEKLVGAENPVVIVGGSGRNLEAVPALVELAELLGLAVVESVARAYLCFPFTHPLYQAADLLDDADAVLILDADVPWVPETNAPPPEAYVAAIGQDVVKHRFPTYEFMANTRLNADSQLAAQTIAEAARSLLKDADKKRINERSARLGEAARARKEAAVKEAQSHAQDTPIDPLWLSYQVGQIVDDNSIVMDDTLGRTRIFDFIPCTLPGSYIRNPGSSGGWAPGAAFGAKLAAPEKDIIAVTGDGFYMFGTPAPAIWAAAHHNAPFLMVVYTNRSYTTGTLAITRTYGEDSFTAKGGYEGGYFDPPIDFAKEAEAAGGYGENVTDPAQVAGALKRGMEQVRAGKPAVISVWQKKLEGED